MSEKDTTQDSNAAVLAALARIEAEARATTARLDKMETGFGELRAEVRELRVDVKELRVEVREARAESRDHLVDIMGDTRQIREHLGLPPDGRKVPKLRRAK